MTTTLELHGYSLVTTPPFEHAEVVDRGLGSDPRDTLRFVDPETSEVSVFRPDLTVQIARVVGSRLADRPRPMRLYYEGHVLRARRGRARRQRQIAQVGAECIGIAGPSGDAEVIGLASRALDSVGLDHVVEIASVPLVRALTAALDSDRRARVTESLARKDRAGVEEALRGARLPRTHRAALIALEGLTGGSDVLEDASRLLAGLDRTGLEGGHVEAVRALSDALARSGAVRRLRFDLGEVRGFDYYTGPSFSLLADGPGEPLGGGGRYDELIGRFGLDAPATGFAIDLDHVARAREVQGAAMPDRGAPHVCVVGSSAAAVLALRGAGVRVGTPAEDSVECAREYARGWGLDAAVSVRSGIATVHWADGTVERLDMEHLATRLLARRPARERESES